MSRDRSWTKRGYSVGENEPRWVMAGVVSLGRPGKKVFMLVFFI